MKPCASTLLAALAAGAPSAFGDTVYRCVVDGRTVYAATPKGYDCQPQELHPAPPAARDTERRRQDLDEWNLRREEQVQRSLDREAATESQRRESALKALGPAQAPKSGAGRKSRRSGGARGSTVTAAPAAAQMPVDRMGVSGGSNK
jgi:hypothetical protein